MSEISAFCRPVCVQYLVESIIAMDKNIEQRVSSVLCFLFVEEKPHSKRQWSFLHVLVNYHFFSSYGAIFHYFLFQTYELSHVTIAIDFPVFFKVADEQISMRNAK